MTPEKPPGANFSCVLCSVGFHYRHPTQPFSLAFFPKL